MDYEGEELGGSYLRANPFHATFLNALIPYRKADAEFECGTTEADSKGGANVEIRHEIVFSIGEIYKLLN